jgi:hypothetical protein
MSLADLYVLNEGKCTEGNTIKYNGGESAYNVKEMWRESN